MRGTSARRPRFGSGSTVPKIGLRMLKSETLATMLCGILVAGLLCIFAQPGRADSAAEANRLLVEAVRLMREADLQASRAGKYALIKRAHDNLVTIVERYPSTDLAVKLATGQRVGSISLSSAQRAVLDFCLFRTGFPGLFRTVRDRFSHALPVSRRWIRTCESWSGLSVPLAGTPNPERSVAAPGLGMSPERAPGTGFQNGDRTVPGVRCRTSQPMWTSMKLISP